MGDKISKETQDKINHLQAIQQRLQLFVSQKQQFQVQLIEIDNALTELKKAKGKTYAIVGGILIEKDKKDLEKDLKDAKNRLELRIKTLDKQEDSLRKEALELQKEVTSKLK